jgi:hypothetical protein
MDCGSGTWGDIPIDVTTQHVDGSFIGTSDGSASAPWTTISGAVVAADPGALVAVAAGSYAEDVLVNKPVRIQGVCPEQVALVGTGQAAGPCPPAALCIILADATEVRGIAIRGAADGVVVSGAAQVVFDRVWVQADLRGMNVQNDLGAASVTLESSLVEGNSEIGVFVQGGEITIDSTVVRDTQLDPQGGGGRGISVRGGLANGTPSLVTVRRSLVERNHFTGVFALGSELTIEETVVTRAWDWHPGRRGRAIGRDVAQHRRRAQSRGRRVHFGLGCIHGDHHRARHHACPWRQRQWDQHSPGRDRRAVHRHRSALADRA